MNPRQHFQAGIILLAAMAVVGCAWLGVAQPETFRQKVVAGYATIEAVNKSALELYNAGKLGNADAANIVAQSRLAVEGLTIAQQLYDAGDLTAAENRLQAIIVALTALQAYLATGGGT